MSHVSIKSLTLDFPLFSAESRSFKSSVFSLFHGGRGLAQRHHRALDDLSLEFEAGDRVCLIGLNGAGKTTLLRAISGILPPTSGRIEIEGSISPLLDFATGFEMEMTGYDNIIARGMFLGYSAADMRQRQPAIAEFAGLGEFLHAPVKVYSSGMFLRLAFAIVTSIDPDILVVDEIVGAGDRSFANKAQARMLDLIDRGSIVIMATHSTDLALKLCNKGVWLQNGRVAKQGEIRSVIEAYAANTPVC